MNIEQLRTLGAFVSTEPAKASVTWNEHTFDVHIRRLSFADVERLIQSGNSSVNLIASTILLGDDLTPITVEQAEQLDVSLAAKLLEAINTVNGSAAAKN